MDSQERLQALERRRRRAARLLRSGVHQAEVSRWAEALEHGSLKALSSAGRTGRPRQLSDVQLEELKRALKAGALAAGYATELWTLPRIARLIDERFGIRLSESWLSRLLRNLGWSVQRPAGRPGAPAR